MCTLSLHHIFAQAFMHHSLFQETSLFCKKCLFLSSPPAARAQPLLASTLSQLSMAGRAASLRLFTREDALRQLVGGGHVGHAWHGGHDGHSGMVKWWL